MAKAIKIELKKEKFEEGKINKYLSWAIGISFLFASLIILFGNFIIGIFYLIGSLILLPPIAQKISKKLNVSLISIKWFIFLGFIILGAIMGSLSGEKQTIQEQQEIKIEKLNLEGMTPEQILDKYMDYSNWVGMTDELNNVKLKKQLAGGSFLKLLEAGESYLESIIISNSNLAKLCDEARQIYGKDICSNAVRALEKRNQKREILSKEKIEETPDIIKIKIKFKNILDNTLNVTEKIEEYTYIFKKDNNVWKIYDSIDESGILTSENLEGKKQEYTQAIQKREELYQNLKKEVEKQQQFNKLTTESFNVITEVIPKDRLINGHWDTYNNNSNKYVISITYYFKDVWLADDYLQVMHDASELFKKLFPLDLKIYQVQTMVKKKYTDDYGHTEEKYLATTSMTRDVYNKIDWDGFESSKLDKITEVNFYETSFYKGLTELQELSDQLKSSGSGVMMPSDFGMGGESFCRDFEIECQQTGDCQGLYDMQSMGLC